MTAKLKSSPVAFAVVASLAAAWAPAASAHHSAAMYDNTKTDMVTGTVMMFNWTNPHVSLDIVAPTPDAKSTAVWTFEASSPGVMSRSGWNKHLLNPGDKVTVAFSPLRDGGFGGGLKKVVLADGRALTYSIGALPVDTAH